MVRPEARYSNKNIPLTPLKGGTGPVNPLFQYSTIPSFHFCPLKHGTGQRSASAKVDIPVIIL